MSYKWCYCPTCGNELGVRSYEAHTSNIVWEKCKNPRCKKLEIKTDEDGYVLEPLSLRGRYVYASPAKK